MQNLRAQLSKIALQFQIFECLSCAAALKQFLIRQGISGKHIKLSIGSMEDPFCNIYHEGLQRNISINGRHEAISTMIDVQEIVFDNIHPEGIRKTDWLESFYCPIQDIGGSFEIIETEF
ncbi:MAG: papain fold toxin domain-containing protein [Leptolyngbyaceae cyanobacterium]